MCLSAFKVLNFNLQNSWNIGNLKYLSWADAFSPIFLLLTVLGLYRFILPNSLYLFALSSMIVFFFSIYFGIKYSMEKRLFSIFANSPGLLMLLAYSLVLIISFRPNILISLSILFSNFLPFIFNDFIFPAEYMSDQFRYLQCSIEIRDSLVCSEPSPTVVFASYIFAFFPVPIIDSVYSLV